MSNEITIVGLGEALFDLLPAGQALGGAPLNVACHAHRLLRARGGRGVVASRLGVDPLGDEVVAELRRRGMSTDYLQRDPDHPTGTVKVTLDQGQPSYEIVEDVAWDYLELTPAWNALAAGASAVCFGTLAQRSPRSRSTIQSFLDAAEQAVRLFDVNFRQHFYSREVVDESCRRATLVKLNEQELSVIAGLIGLTAESTMDRLAELRARYDLQGVVYTRGERGTVLVLENEVVAPPAVSYPAAPDADAVGAGDACSAAVLAGWAVGIPPAEIAELANQAGAFVASQPGATPQLPDEIVRPFSG